MPVLIHLGYKTKKAATAKFFLLCILCDLSSSSKCSGGKQSSGVIDIDFLPRRASVGEGSDQHKQNGVSKLRAFFLHLENGGQVWFDFF